MALPFAQACPAGTLPPLRPSLAELRAAYRLRTRRRVLLLRALRKRRELTAVADRTPAIRRGAILCFATVRDEAVRLPHFLAHHRRLGVQHFLFVDNGSTDGTVELLRNAPDVSLWSTQASYRASRFGMDWVTWLMMRHGHGHWCLALDADETLIYPHWETRDLHALTHWLDRQRLPAMPAMMLDLYPQGRLSAHGYTPGQDPASALPWFDRGNYSVQVQPRMRNLWVQGGPRARALLAETPRQAPTLNKTPLVRWHWRYAWVNSTHALLPRRLNRVYAEDGGERISGILLHSKFLNTAPARAATEKARGEHFGRPADFAPYWDGLSADPDLWCPASTRLTGWRQLESLGLMSRGGWV
jgi:hypothetical protein